MGLTQQNRDAAISAVGQLDEDVLVLAAFAGREDLGRLFEYEADLLSNEHDVEFDKVIGENVTVRLETANAGTRYFNGIVSRFVQQPPHNQYASYRATIVPWFWLLTRTSDCRIFQNKTVPEIIEAIFKKHEMKNFESQLTATYTPWEYCVQYRETDFNFVSRLMEQEGIYYYFKHEDGKHTMVLSDSMSKHVPFAGYEEIHFRPPGEGSADPERIRDWVINKELSSGTFVHKDFDFENPKTDLCTEPAMISREHSQAKFEIYDYPGEYAKPGDGKDWAQIRVQELQARHELLHGGGDTRGLVVGSTFELKDFGRDDQNRKYLVVAANHNINVGGFESGDSSGGETCYVSFTVIPVTEVFRPARITPKPLIQGLQTAIVAGPKGEEIHTDKYGRVKLKFHWDRYCKGDESSSCWVRVSQSWAGKKWGAMYIPRIGQEVVVEFLEGDPDLPIVTGRVYNGDAAPPYDLPAKATLSTLKSNSSKGGQGFNEIRFEDKKGDEQIFMHGEKNLDIRIKNDVFEWTGNNRHLVVKKDQFEHVENNRHEKVDADHKEKIGKDRHLNIVGKESKEVGDSHSFTVKGDVIEVFQGNHSEQTTSDYYLKADNIVIEGMTNVTIKVGQSYIAIEASGITIGATQVEIQGQATVDVKSPQTTVNGDGTLTLKGGMTMINS